MSTTDDPNGYRAEFEQELNRLNNHVRCSDRWCDWSRTWSDGGLRQRT
jgi:hypothetical protein